jgi:hypothetical protein
MTFGSPPELLHVLSKHLLRCVVIVVIVNTTSTNKTPPAREAHSQERRQ